MDPIKIFSKADIKDELDLTTGHWCSEVVVSNCRQIDLINNRVDEFISKIDHQETLIDAPLILNLYLFQLRHGFYNDYYEHTSTGVNSLTNYYKLRIDYSINKLSEALTLIEGVLSKKNNDLPKRKNAPSYIFNKEVILKVHEQFNGDIWEEMDFVDFISCFDINNKPDIYPIFLKGKQKTFGYILTKSDNHGLTVVNETMALSCFGLRNYRGMKSELKKEHHVNIITKREIDKVFK